MTNTPPSSQEKPSFTLLNGLSFCVVDLETTGGNHKYDKIIEIGLIKVESMNIVDELSFLINPEIPIPEFIQKLTSIDPKSLVDCPTIEQVVDQIVDFIGDSILVAHNSSFDIPFLNSVLLRLKLSRLGNKTLCTNLMTKNLIPEIVSSNLPYMSKIFGIHHTRAHRALEDARATAYLLIQYLSFFIEKNIRKVNQLYYPRKKFELDSYHVKNTDNIPEIVAKIRSIKAPLLIVFKGEKGVILNVIPLNRPMEEMAFFEKKLQDPLWKTISLKMVGSFVQGLYQFHHYLPKLPKPAQSEILEHLWQVHLPAKISSASAPLEINHQEGKFLVARHLIPEQFILYCLPPSQHTRDLIFRYPGHFQKLVQHIERCQRRMESRRPKVEQVTDPFSLFFYSYLEQARLSGDSAYFFFTGADFRRGTEWLQEKLENYSTLNHNYSQFPKEHI